MHVQLDINLLYNWVFANKSSIDRKKTEMFILQKICLNIDCKLNGKLNASKYCGSLLLISYSEHYYLSALHDTWFYQSTWPTGFFIKGVRWMSCHIEMGNLTPQQISSSETNTPFIPLRVFFIKSKYCSWQYLNFYRISLIFLSSTLMFTFWKILLTVYSYQFYCCKCNFVSC